MFIQFHSLRWEVRAMTGPMWLLVIAAGLLWIGVPRDLLDEMRDR